MTDKMEKIEAKIKGSVDETTGSVKRMVDVKYQVSQHPWTALGISVLAGIALGSMGDNDSSPQHRKSYDGGMSNTDAYERARSTSAYPSNYGSSTYGQGSYGGSNYGSSNYGQGSYGGSTYGQSGSNYGQSSYGSSNYGSDRPYSQEHNQFGGSSHSTYGSTGSNQGSYASNSFAPSGSSWGTQSSMSTGSGAWNQSQSSKPGVMDQITRQFGGEIETLKSAAVSSLVSVLRDTIRQNFPSMHQEMERMRRDSGAASGSSSWSGTGGSSNYGSNATSTGSSNYGSNATSTGSSNYGSNATSTGSTSNTDYAASAVNNPSHVTGISDPARGSSSFDAKSSPDDLERGGSTF